LQKSFQLAYLYAGISRGALQHMIRLVTNEGIAREVDLLHAPATGKPAAACEENF
jgi:hypothetical protein